MQTNNELVHETVSSLTVSVPVLVFNLICCISNTHVPREKMSAETDLEAKIRHHVGIMLLPAHQQL